MVSDKLSAIKVRYLIKGDKRLELILRLSRGRDPIIYRV